LGISSTQSAIRVYGYGRRFEKSTVWRRFGHGLGVCGSAVKYPATAEHGWSCAVDKSKVGTFDVGCRSGKSLKRDMGSAYESSGIVVKAVG